MDAASNEDVAGPFPLQLLRGNAPNNEYMAHFKKWQQLFINNGCEFYYYGPSMWSARRRQIDQSEGGLDVGDKFLSYNSGGVDK